MKKKKITYSLTAKERKALRRGDNEKKEEEKVEQPPELNAEGGEAVTTAPESKFTKKQLTVMLSLIAVGLAVILVGSIVLGVLLPRYSSKYPRAIITLNDGRKIEMVIWEDECPIMASNFIFLARIGFFNGTIIYDVEPGREYMRFGAYKGYGTGETRYEDVSFISKIDKKVFNIEYVGDESDRVKAESSKFGYRLYKDDTNEKDRFSEAFVVSANYASAADFVINLGENNTSFTNQNGTTSLNSNLSAFAKIEDAKSQEVLRSIYERDDIVATNLSFGTSYIYGPSTPVVIKSVTVTNINRKKWKNFEFISYMNTAYRNKTSAFRSWVA